MYCWPRDEIIRHLRARSGYLSLHDLDDEANVIARGPSEVVFPV
jgi:hypothetical protein